MRADTDESDSSKGHITAHTSHVVEQRVSNLAQGLLTLGTMAGPLLVVIHLIPEGVLAGLFFVMGVQALEGNGITVKILFLCKDASLTPASDPLKRIARRSAVWKFVAIQLLGFGATFAITQTIAAIGFPLIILLLIPFRTLVMPRWFSPDELAALDAPTASPFTMESVGGNFGQVVGGEGVVGEGVVVADQLGIREEMAERGEGLGVGRNVERKGSTGISRRSVSSQPVSLKEAGRV